MDQQALKKMSKSSEKLQATRIKSQWRFFGTLLVVVALLAIGFAFYFLLKKSIDEKALVSVPNQSIGSGNAINVDSVSVQGVGVASAQPNQARINFSVETQASSAAIAAQQNAQQSAALAAALKATDMNATISTENYSVFPITDDKQQITGYRANNTISVEINPPSQSNSPVNSKLLENRVSALIDTATQSGYANLVGGVDFSLAIKTRDVLLQQARSKAVQNALQNATVLAQSAKRNLGSVISINDASGQPEFVPLYRTRAAAAPSADASTPINAPQTLDVTANVNVVYNLQP